MTGLTPGTYNLTTSLKGCTKTESWEVKATAASPTTPVSLAIVPACSSTLVINWNAVANATSYGIQLSEDSGFLTPVTVGVVTYDGRNDKGNVLSNTPLMVSNRVRNIIIKFGHTIVVVLVLLLFTLQVQGKGDAIWILRLDGRIKPIFEHKIILNKSD